MNADEKTAAQELLPVFQAVASEMEWPEEVNQAMVPILGPQWFLWILMGIASRESDFGLLLDENDKGDGGHGHGIMQIDNRSHGEFLSTHNWRDPETNIRYGLAVLKDTYNYLSDYFGYFNEDYGNLFMGALSGYNCGAGNVLKALKAGQNIDGRTTGKDYAKDTSRRALFIREEFGKA